MPIVRIEMWAGKEDELKRKLARDITDVMVENVGCPRQRVTILFSDVPKDDK